MDKRNMGASVLKRSPGIYTNVVALIYIPLFQIKNKQYVTFKNLHGFGQTKFLGGGSVLCSSQFLILSHLPQNILIDSQKWSKSTKNNQLTWLI